VYREYESEKKNQKEVLKKPEIVICTLFTGQTGKEGIFKRNQAVKKPLFFRVSRFEPWARLRGRR